MAAYLAAYNLIQAGGWSWCLAQAAVSVAKCNGCLTNVFKDTMLVVCSFQALAILETLHAAAGLVRGSPANAFVQWAGRSNVLFATLLCIPELWTNKAAGILIIAWALSEVVRYPWYVAQLLGSCPDWLTWLRYSAFIPLYPIGIWAEMRLLFDGLPYLADRDLHSVHLPNAANFAFDYATFIKVLLCIYPIFGYQLYSFVWSQRNKKLGTPWKTKKD